MPRRPLIFMLCLLAGWFHAGTAHAQASPEAEAGWRSAVEGLRHFTGLRCPDIVGAFFRIKVMDGDGPSLAGCIYTGRDGITAVLRSHLQGSGRQEALNFARRYKAAGFEPLKLSGAAETGTSFKTGANDTSTHCETLWYFDGAEADFTLWMSYTLPTQEIDIGPAVTSFTEALARQN